MMKPLGTLDKSITNGLRQSQLVGGMKIMDGTNPDIGEQLRAARVARGLALSSLADELCICSRQLEALEDNQTTALPEQVYAIGFLRTYAGRLGLNADQLSDQYKILHGVDPATTELHFPEPIRETQIPTLSLMAGGIGALIAVYAGWSSLSGADLREASLVSAPPESLVAMIATDGAAVKESVVSPESDKVEIRTETMTALNEAGSADKEIVSQVAGESSAESPSESATAIVRMAVVDGTASETTSAGRTGSAMTGSALIGSAMASETDMTASLTSFSGASAGASRVQILARADTWIMITDSEGQLLMEGVIRAGERYVPPSVPGLKLSASNAAGLEVTVDGQLVKDLGAWGTVVNALPLDGGANSNLRLN